jgi:hypothetical protein
MQDNPASLHKISIEEQIARWITQECQLGGDSQRGITSPVHGLSDEVAIAWQIAYSGIELQKGYFHPVTI